MRPVTGIVRTLDLRSSATQTTDRDHWRLLCARSVGLDGPADEAARQIIHAVRERGDEAVCELTKRFESRDLTPQTFAIDAEAQNAAAARCSPALRQALELAAGQIRDFHRTQLPRDTGLQTPGNFLQSRATPLRRVAVYAPGGTAAYPSSVLMAGIPAKVAGVPEVVLLTPNPTDAVLLAAQLAGVDQILAIGGAQAIAAVALGTQTIPRVDKIVGPGNAYVTAAKRQVFGLCDIDAIAGPSEVLIIADTNASPTLIAADLLAQAEHDRLACPILVTDAPALVPAVIAKLREQLRDLPRAEIAAAALRDHGALVLVDDRDGLVAAANAYAPEHLEVLTEAPEQLAPQLTTAGAIFLGAYTPEAAGDYTAGPSHVLPTAGAARFASPLGVWDFIKHTSILQLSADTLKSQATAITEIARAEGLEAHARAVEHRLAGDKA